MTVPRDFIIREIGCVIARMLGLGYVPCERHHLTVGGKHGQKRRGEAASVGLNCWSHRGVVLPGMTEAECREKFGPSYAREPRAFREAYPDATLLAYQNERIADWKAGTLGAAA